MSLLKHHKREHKHHAKDRHVKEALIGVVLAYNYSPRGGIEGMLIQESERTVQVNLPPDLGLAISLAVEVGRSIEATVETEPEDKKHPQGDHPVRRFVAIKTDDGRMFASDDHASEETLSVEAIVHRLNYAKHGEANGVVLESGDFLHLKPAGMKRCGLQIGQHVTAEGLARRTLQGGRAIEAEVVNGTSLNSKKPRG